MSEWFLIGMVLMSLAVIAFYVSVKGAGDRAVRADRTPGKGHGPLCTIRGPHPSDPPYPLDNQHQTGHLGENPLLGVSNRLLVRLMYKSRKINRPPTFKR